MRPYRRRDHCGVDTSDRVQRPACWTWLEDGCRFNRSYSTSDTLATKNMAYDQIRLGCSGVVEIWSLPQGSERGSLRVSMHMLHEGI
jgi:hypothetical protein